MFKAEKPVRQKKYIFAAEKSCSLKFEAHCVARTLQESARCVRCCFEIFEVFSFGRADKALEIFEFLKCNLR